MARIAGINIPDNKKTPIALGYIYGIGRPMALKILSEAKIDVNKRTKELTSQEIARLRDIIEKKYKVEGELRREIIMKIKKIKKNKY